MASSERGKGVKAKADAPAPTEPKETSSIMFEWPLKGLKQMFDSSKSDLKSKVIKSAPFGGGRWTVLFYAQSGHDQFCSLYLNAEPLPHERQNPMLASASPFYEIDKHANLSSGSLRGSGSTSKTEAALEEKWTRGGLFRFTFNIQTLEDKTVLGTKEAHDHAFSHRTSNWGWAQFAKRDHVYYKNSDVIREDAFLITVTITASSEKPKAAEPPMHSIPPVLASAMGSLLDDPEHSDVVFHLVPSKRRGVPGQNRLRKVYAIRKILAARSEYFRLMFESGFQEGELEDSSDEDDDVMSFGAGHDAKHRHSPAHPHNSHHAVARAKQQSSRAARLPECDVDSDIESYTHDVVFDDSDEDYDEDSDVDAHNDLLAPADVSRRDRTGSNSPEGDAEGDGDDDMRSIGDQAPASDDELAEDRFSSTHSKMHSANSRQSLKSVAQEPETYHIATADFEESSVAASSSTTRLGADDITNLRSSTSGSPRESALIDPDSTLSRGTSTKASSPVPSASHKAKRNRGDVVMRHASRTDMRAAARIDRRKRRKVTVMDSAYPTFRALLYFLYTDTVEFAPLTSSFLPPHVANEDVPDPSLPPASRLAAKSLGTAGLSGTFIDEMHIAHRKRKAVIEAFQDKNPDRPAPCSAKAMYRLADKLDIPDLKRRAQEHIAQSLTTDNIVWEVFSGFNIQYPDIRKMETDFLLKHWPQVKRSNAMKSIFWRASAHPGLAEVWPYLLEFLEYKPTETESSETML